MPYLRGDPELLAEMGIDFESDELPDGFGEEFVYETAEATFKPQKLEALAKAALDGLKAQGATAFRVKYDGGFDEGFAHADYVVIGEKRKSASAVARELGNAEWLKGVRKAIAGENRLAGYANLADAKLADEALYNLAHELASTLLGEGYGTGEYQLYGAFLADLESGQIVDEPGAERPEGME